MPTTSQERYLEAVRRAKSVDAALDTFRQPAMPVASTKSSSGIAQIVIDGDLLPAATPVVAMKADRSALHPRLKSVAPKLSDNSARLLDLVVRKDEEFGSSRLVDVVVQQIAGMLELSVAEAEDARRDLEARGLIQFFDNYCGDRGFRPKV